MARRSVHSLRALKDRGERFAMITCYDYPSARLVDQVGIPGVLVGDSLGMVVLGYDSTVPVTMDEIIHHTKPVVRGTQRAFVVADMPFGSYQAGEDEAMRNAVRLLQEGGATAVKLEGGVRVAGIVERLVAAGVPVMGHLGLTPQSVRQFGGHKLQGKTDSAAARLLDDARALERAGAFAVVLECIPAPLGVEITRELRIPTVGIGAGVGCDGEIQVWHDVLGLSEDFLPKHASRFAKLAPQIRHGLENYVHAVRRGEFPGPGNSFDAKPNMSRVLTALFEELGEELGAPSR